MANFRYVVNFKLLTLVNLSCCSQVKVLVFLQVISIVMGSHSVSVSTGCVMVHRIVVMVLMNKTVVSIGVLKYIKTHIV